MTGWSVAWEREVDGMQNWLWSALLEKFVYTLYVAVYLFLLACLRYKRYDKPHTGLQ